jgi:hypothetical protein
MLIAINKSTPGLFQLAVVADANLSQGPNHVNFVPLEAYDFVAFRDIE